MSVWVDLSSVHECGALVVYWVASVLEIDKPTEASDGNSEEVSDLTSVVNSEATTEVTLEGKLSMLGSKETVTASRSVDKAAVV